MFIAVNRITVRKGEGEEIEKRFSESEGIEELPGFISFRLLKDSWAGPARGHGAGMEEAVPVDEYLSLTEWKSMDDFINWTNSEAFRKAHAGQRVASVVSSKPTGYDVVCERVK